MHSGMRLDLTTLRNDSSTNDTMPLQEMSKGQADHKDGKETKMHAGKLNGVRSSELSRNSRHALWKLLPQQLSKCSQLEEENGLAVD